MKSMTKLISTLLLALTLIACGTAENTTNETPTSAPIVTVEDTATLDPCLAPQLTEEVAKVNKLMREFDDYSTLASNTPQNQLVIIIPELQRVLREAEEQVIPSCLLTLKNYQLEHMKSVVQTLLVFMSNSDPNFVNANIAKARELHMLYDVEMARLLGLTLPARTPPPPGTTETANEPTNTSSPATITNPGPNELNLRTTPDFNSATPAILPVGAVATAFGRTADNLWIQVEIPNQPGVLAWVYASNVNLSIPIEQLPIALP
jgi:hypothetical protein